MNEIKHTTIHCHPGHGGRRRWWWPEMVVKCLNNELIPKTEEKYSPRWGMTVKRPVWASYVSPPPIAACWRSFSGGSWAALVAPVFPAVEDVKASRWWWIPVEHKGKREREREDELRLEMSKDRGRRWLSLRSRRLDVTQKPGGDVARVSGSNNEQKGGRLAVSFLTRRYWTGGDVRRPRVAGGCSLEWTRKKKRSIPVFSILRLDTQT